MYHDYSSNVNDNVYKVLQKKNVLNDPTRKNNAAQLHCDEDQDT